MQPLVSVVIPVYNAEEYLKQCIDSVIDQTYHNLEIILVDDGSPDKCPEICDQYAVKDPRIKVIHKRNAGVSAARNTGIDNATGEFIMFVDSDDYIDEHTVENAVQKIIASKAEIAIWGYYIDYVDEDGTLFNTEIEVPSEEEYYKGQQNNIMIKYVSSGIMGYVWNKLYLAKIIKYHELNFRKDISLFEDIYFNACALSNAKKIAFIAEPLTHYIQRPRETLGTKYYENIFELKKIAIKAKKKMLDNYKIDPFEIEELIKKEYYYAVRSSLMSIARSNLSFSEKIKKMNDFGYSDEVKKILRNKPNFKIRELIIYYLIKFKLNKILFVLWR